MAVVLDNFNSRKLVFVNPIYEFSWIPFFVGNFLNLEVKEETFGGLDCILELFLYDIQRTSKGAHCVFERDNI